MVLNPNVVLKNMVTGLTLSQCGQCLGPLQDITVHVEIMTTSVEGKQYLIEHAGYGWCEVCKEHVDSFGWEEFF